MASYRYARLLALEVPPKKQSDALIEIYREKNYGDATKLQYVFKSLIDVIEDHDLSNFLEVVSDELKITRSDDCVRIVLQTLPEELWPQIDEVARLRTENKLIESIRLGEYNSEVEKIQSGWLGTWAVNFIRFFVLKDQLYDVFLRKLKGPVECRNYVAKYFLSSMPHTLTKSSNSRLDVFLLEEYVNEIVDIIADPSNSFFRDRLIDEIGYLPSDWQNLIVKGFRSTENFDGDYDKKLVAAIANHF